jgi:hypothetical protein
MIHSSDERAGEGENPFPAAGDNGDQSEPGFCEDRDLKYNPDRRTRMMPAVSYAAARL